MNISLNVRPAWAVIVVAIAVISIANAASFAQEIIDPRTGQLQLEVTDLVVPAGPLTLDLTRTFQSRDAPAGILGAGWRLNWESSIYIFASEAVIFEGGNTTMFRPKGEQEGLQGPLGERLSFEGDHRAVRRGLGGVVSVYEIQDGVGRLTKLTDPNGNTILVRYSEGGFLRRVEGPMGSSLDFTVDKNGRVIHVESSFDTSVDYSFAEGRLAQARSNGGPPESYIYDELARLVAIDRPAAGRVDLTYDSSDRVTGRRWADRGEELFEYLNLGREVVHTHPTNGISVDRWSADGLRHEFSDTFGHTTVTQYDSEYRPTAIIDPTGATTRYVYDAASRVERIEEPGAQITRFEYRGDTQLVTIVERPDGTREAYDYDSFGNLVTHTIGGEVFRSYAYTRNGLLERVGGIGLSDVVYQYYPSGMLHTKTDSLGRTTTYVYDQRGNLVALTEPGDRVTRWRYDRQNRITGETEPTGQTTRYEYDPSGRLIAIENPLGSTTRFTHDAGGSVATETDPMGNTWVYSYRPDGQLDRVTDPEGNAQLRSYDSRGRLVGIVDSLGSIVAYEYDELDRVVTETGAGGDLRTYKWGSGGSVIGIDAPGYVSHVDPKTGVEQILKGAGEPQTIERDSLGRIISTRGASGTRLVFSYDSAGNLVTIEDDHGLRTTFQYDAAGRRTQAVYPTGLQVDYRYDMADRIVSIADSLEGSVAFAYDAAGRTVAVTEAGAATTRFSYDADGRLTERIDPLGHTNTYTYDAAGRLRELVAGSGENVRFDYDAAGRLVMVRHPGGGTTSYSRDARGNAVREVCPLGSTTTRRFDTSGRLVEEIDPSGGITTLDYDERGLLNRVTRADGVTVRYQYDAEGRPTQVDDAAFPVQFDYTEKGNVSRVFYPALNREIRFSFDEMGRRTQLIDPEGHKFNSLYDRFGRLEAIVLGDGARLDLSYDLKDRLDAITYPNRVVEKYSYDPAGRILAVEYRDASGAVLAGRSSTVDAAGNPLSVEREDGTTTRFQYDRAGQLVETTTAGASARFDYHPGGHRASVSRDGSTSNFIYDRAGRLLRTGEEIFQYDARGNVIERAGPAGTTRYRWDGESRLIEALLPGGRSVRFGYAPTGEKIWREDSEGRIWYLYDGENLIAALDSELRVQSSFVHGPGLDQPLLMTSADGARHSYLRDALGTIIGLADANGKVAGRYRTDAFGTPESKARTPANPFLFTARPWDPDLGLYDYRHRVYDPRLGRFLSPDPLKAEISTPLDLERYTYAYNAPTRYTDPLGLRIDTWDMKFLFQTRPQAAETTLQSVRRLTRTWGGNQKDIVHMVMDNYRHQKKLWAFRDAVRRPEHLSISKPSFEKAIESVERQLDLSRLHHRPGVDPRSPSSRIEGARRFLQQQQQKDYAGVVKQLEHQGTRLRGNYGSSAPPTGGGPTSSQGPGGTRIGAAPSASGTGSTGGGSPSTGSTPSGASGAPPSEGANLPVPHGGNAVVPVVGPAAGGGAASAQAPTWNPNYRPNPLSSTRGPWAPITPTPPTAWEKFTKPPTAVQGGTLTLLLTGEMIARCRSQGLTAGECAQKFLSDVWDAKYLIAGVATVCLVAPTVGTVIIAVGAIYKGVTDVIESAYAAKGAWDAAENRDRILEDRKKWTEKNVQDEAGMKRLLLLETKIRDTADALRGACRNLEGIGDAMTEGVKSAEAELAKKPSAETINAGADACRTLQEKNARLRAIQADIDPLVDQIKGEVEAARSLAEACRTKQDAVKLKALIQNNDATLGRIENGMAEAKKIQGELDRDRAKIDAAQNALRRAMDLRQRLSDAANSMPPIASSAAEVRRAESAIDLLTDPSPSLGNDIKNLVKAFGDYDDLSLEMISEINQLRQLVRNAQSLVVECAPADYLSRHRDAANKIVTAKLQAQALIDQVDAAPLADCNIGSLGALAQAIQKSATGVSSLRSANDEAKNKAKQCLADHGLSIADSGGGSGSGTTTSSGGSGDETPPLVEASRGGSGGGGGSGGKPPLVDASKPGGPTTGGDPKTPPGVGASDAVKPQPGDEELVYANVDIELAQDDYGIYDILDKNNIKDYEIIVKTPRGDKQYLGADAVKYLAERGWIIHRGGVGWIATDRFKRFLGIGEPDEPDKKKDGGRPTLGGMTFDATLTEYNPDDPNTPEGKRKILGELSRQCQASAAWGRFWACLWDDCMNVLVDAGLESSHRCNDACSDEFEKNKPPVCHEADALAAQLEKKK